MTMHHAFPAALAFILGATLLAGGESEAHLRERLSALRAQAARVEAQTRAEAGAADLPPAADDGMRFGLIPIADVILPIVETCPPYRMSPAPDPPLSSGPMEEAPQTFGTFDEVMELVRSVAARQTDAGGMLAVVGHGILVREKAMVIAAMRRFVDRELRPRAARTVAIEARLVEAPAAHGAAHETNWGTHVGKELDPVIVQGLLAREPVFFGRILARSDQLVLLWHGGQIALASDPDVVVQKSAKASDPNIETELLGGIVSVRATARDNSDRIRVDVRIEHRRLAQPVREQTTRDSGALQLPTLERSAVAGVLNVQSGRWALAGIAQHAAGTLHLLLVRARVLARKEER